MSINPATRRFNRHIDTWCAPRLLPAAAAISFQFPARLSMWCHYVLLVLNVLLRLLHSDYFL